MGNRWETKEDFISWIEAENKSAKLQALKHTEYYNEKDFTNSLSDYDKNLRNSNIDIGRLKTIIDNEFLEYVNYIYSICNNSLEAFHYDVFLSYAEEFTFFIKSKFSTDAKEFQREIDQLKKYANKVSYFSYSDIKIRLPQLPQDTLYMMIGTLKESGLSEECIRLFFNYFERIRYPKKTKSLSTQVDTFFDRINHYYKEHGLTFDQAIEKATKEIKEYTPS